MRMREGELGSVYRDREAIVRQGDSSLDLRALIKKRELELKTLTSVPVPTAGSDAEGAAASLREREQQLASIEASASTALSDMETERSQYSTPYLPRILKASASQEPGMRKMLILSAGS